MTDVEHGGRRKHDRWRADLTDEVRAGAKPGHGLGGSFFECVEETLDLLLVNEHPLPQW